jgi:S-adenosylmethionine:tRNA ribosyltransferase-isomerase
MKTMEFDYLLPQELIADVPAKKRDDSRLLSLGKDSGLIVHNRFFELKKYFQKGDILVLNNSKVFPARLIGKKETGGSAELLLNHQADGLWEAMGKRVKVGQRILFEKSDLEALIVRKEAEIVYVKFNFDGEELFKKFEKIGSIPIPPYIEAKRKKDGTNFKSDKERYQTVYAKESGSCAAPTAGLHFTQALLAELNVMGVEILEVTLHVGLGTFAPITETDPTKHQIHEEYYQIKKEVLLKIESAKEDGRRVVSVGTTATRVLETIFNLTEKERQNNLTGWTKIFIYPSYKFKCVDGLITNFHLPASSLMLLVSAFAGKENILKAYNEAIKNKYRFYSYGDAMLII